jgi:hypothetical protein
MKLPPLSRTDLTDVERSLVVKPVQALQRGDSSGTLF